MNKPVFYILFMLGSLAIDFGFATDYYTTADVTSLGGTPGNRFAIVQYNGRFEGEVLVIRVNDEDTWKSWDVGTQIVLTQRQGFITKTEFWLASNY